jgi:Phage integrase, N-terminal SAM-like domain
VCRTVSPSWSRRFSTLEAALDRSSTATQYKRDIRNHLLPEFGPYRLDQIEVEQVERFRDKLTRCGLSSTPSSV